VRLTPSAAPCYAAGVHLETDATVAAGDARRRELDADRRYLGRYPLIPGNRATLLVDGAQAYPAMLDAISRAERSILLESYIFRADRAGRTFLEALVERAQAGVEVRVLVDGVGSGDTPPSFWEPLQAHRGRVAVFRPLQGFFRVGKRFWQRDHRKLLVVDDQVGFIGGMNIGDDYAPVDWGGEGWHDAHVRIDGPAARGLAQLFHGTWRQLDRADPGPRIVAGEIMGNVGVQILEGRLTRRHSVRQSYLHAIRNARHTIRITNAYCIPDRPVRRALRGARRRGVHVQMMLAGRTDLRSVQFAGRYLYRALMETGIEIYEWTDRVLHAKSAVIDGRWCSIGSYNLERRSLLHNLEANIACVDATLGAALDAQFVADLPRARRIDPETWHRRPAFEKLAEAFFYQLRYLL
jgi:cardiolipin synthase